MPPLPSTACRYLSALALVLFAGGALACSAPPSDVSALRADVDALKAAQERTAAELAEMKALVERALGPGAAAGAAAPASPPPGAVRTLSIANRASRGAATARVVFIEYSDYGCPFCAQYVADVYPRLLREYVEPGHLRYVFKNYPIEELHPGVFKAHVAAACAGDQGQYWQMHDRLFAAQGDFQADRLVEHARGAGLDTVAFESCLAGTSHDALIREDIDEAVRGGVRGTPVFVVGLLEPTGAVVTPLQVVVGAQPYQAFKNAIDAVLARAGGGSSNE
ncbi:MAG: DsbA family protein [Vicinamibacterales bacterium]